MAFLGLKLILEKDQSRLSCYGNSAQYGILIMNFIISLFIICNTKEIPVINMPPMKIVARMNQITAWELAIQSLELYKRYTPLIKGIHNEPEKN